MTANFKLPEEGELFDVVEFVELQRDEAGKLVGQYNKEGENAGFGQKKGFRGGFHDRRGGFMENRGGYGKFVVFVNLYPIFAPENLNEMFSLSHPHYLLGISLRSHRNLYHCTTTIYDLLIELRLTTLVFS